MHVAILQVYYILKPFIRPALSSLRWWLEANTRCTFHLLISTVDCRKTRTKPFKRSLSWSTSQCGTSRLTPEGQTCPAALGGAQADPSPEPCEVRMTPPRAGPTPEARRGSEGAPEASPPQRQRRAGSQQPLRVAASKGRWAAGLACGRRRLRITCSSGRTGELRLPLLPRLIASPSCRGRQWQRGGWAELSTCCRHTGTRASLAPRAGLRLPASSP